MKEEREKGSERKQLQGLRSMIQGDRVQLNRSHGRVSGGVIVVVVGEGDYCCCEGGNCRGQRLECPCVYCCTTVFP
jgi:hypothetical protein